MQQLSITIPQEKPITYPIIIGENLLENIASYINLKNYTKIIIITDKNIPEMIIEKVKQGTGNSTSVIAIEGNDRHKTIDQVQTIWRELSRECCDRKSLVIIVGGGTLSDMGGFAASTYMRGIDFITIPTTVLAQVDASVGGKTGINFLEIKNLIGTFQQPKAVIIDSDTLTSLPKRELISGFGEIIKHGIIADKTYFKKVTAKKPEDYTTEELLDIIKDSCEIKAAIVQNDETEQDKRKLLNVGHTVGHAIEAISLETNNPLLHGEAISIGMVAEAKIAEEIGLLSHEAFTAIKQSLIHAGLPVSIENMDTNEIIERMKKDKKNIGGNINFTLIKTIGHGICDQQIVGATLAVALKEVGIKQQPNTTARVTPTNKPINTEVTIPGCLSYTIRALNIAAMTKGRVKITNALKSDDTYAMFNALKTLGIKAEEGKDYYIVHGDIADVQDNEYEININISGRTARTILALLCIVKGTKILTCEESFKKRPVGDLVDGLRQLGAEIIYLEKEGYLPVKITSSTLHAGVTKMKGTLSSQYFSAIMMIAPQIGEITIEVIGEQASKPFIDVTIEAMKEFGVTVENESYQRYIIHSGQTYQNPHEYIVEADAISASYFWAIAAITKSRIKVPHLSPESKQGDAYFADILGQMGCKVEKNREEQWISVEGTDKLHGITIDMNNTPDTVQTLAVVAAFAKGTTHITGLEHLKIKETDRIEAPKKELQKMGIEVASTNDSLTIHGGNPHGATIETYGDHRMAMSFAVAGIKIKGIEIKNPEVVNKSFPNFWKTISLLSS